MYELKSYIYFNKMSKKITYKTGTFMNYVFVKKIFNALSYCKRVSNGKIFVIEKIYVPNYSFLLDNILLDKTNFSNDIINEIKSYCSHSNEINNKYIHEYHSLFFKYDYPDWRYILVNSKDNKFLLCQLEKSTGMNYFYKVILKVKIENLNLFELFLVNLFNYFSYFIMMQIINLIYYICYIFYKNKLSFFSYITYLLFFIYLTIYYFY